jgi:hypothetical protein
MFRCAVEKEQARFWKTAQKCTQSGTTKAAVRQVLPAPVFASTFAGNKKPPAGT